MIFIETDVFTDCIRDLLSDEEYSALQRELLSRPQAGALIRGTGGARKIRWRLHNTGKSGGIRVIYYWDVRHDCIYLLLAYRKARQETLTSAQRSILADLIRSELK